MNTKKDSKQNSIGLGLVGCGGHAIGRNLEPMNRLTDKLHLAAAFDIDPKKAEETCRRFGGTPMPDLASLLHSDAVDAVIVATPNSHHFKDTMAALDAGKHVLVNVPVTLSPDEARQMIDRARSLKRVIMPGSQYLRNPALIAMQKSLKEGVAGTQHLMQACVSGPSAYKLDANSWRRLAGEAPLLPFSQLGIVATEIALMLWGTPETVSAVMTKRGDSPTKSPDLGAVISKYSDGRIFVLACSYVAYNNYWLSVSGTIGKIFWDGSGPGGNSLFTDTDKGILRLPYVSKNENLEEMLEFRRCILEGAEPDLGAEYMYNTAEFFRAVGESIASGKVAKFSPYRKS